MSRINWNDVHDFICRNKDNGYTWKDISDEVADAYGVELSPNACRCREQRFLKRQLLDSGLNEFETSVLNDSIKDSCRVQDYMNQATASMRRISREQTIIDIANDYADKMCEKVPIKFETKLLNGNNMVQGILCISDWHYGIMIDNYYNKYNPEIAVERVHQLFSKVVDCVYRYNLGKLVIVNLGDMIAGRIHAPIKMESRMDSISQIMEVSELIAMFLSDLSQFVDIEYYEVLDNHSRLEPNVKESLDLESLARITGFYLKQRLKDNKRIEIKTNRYSEDILTFEIMGHKVAGVHGDKDKQKSVINSLTLYTKEFYDLILTAHLHHFSADEQNDVVRISNGSLMGTDSYAIKLRLNSHPSQTLIISSKENVIESIHKLNLD